MMPLAWPSTTTRSSISWRVEHLHAAERDLPLQRLERAEEQLLAGLAAGVERARHLHAAERAVLEQAAVLARERHALRDGLVDDVDATAPRGDGRCLAGAVVAAFDRVVEEAVDRVAVVLVILRGVDAALRGDGVRAPRRVVEDEALDVVAELAERRRGRRAGQSGADHDDVVLPLVGRIDQLVVRLRVVPLLRRAGREGSCCRVPSWSSTCTIPASTAIGNEMLPTVMISANAVAK